jgi:hypothetical protein
MEIRIDEKTLIESEIRQAIVEYEALAEAGAGQSDEAWNYWNKIKRNLKKLSLDFNTAHLAHYGSKKCQSYLERWPDLADRFGDAP